MILGHMNIWGGKNRGAPRISTPAYCWRTNSQLLDNAGGLRIHSWKFWRTICPLLKTAWNYVFILETAWETCVHYWRLMEDYMSTPWEYLRTTCPLLELEEYVCPNWECWRIISSILETSRGLFWQLLQKETGGGLSVYSWRLQEDRFPLL